MTDQAIAINALNQAGLIIGDYLDPVAPETLRRPSIG
jgi:hypothetical protein